MLLEGNSFKGSTSEWLFNLNFTDSTENIFSQNALYLHHHISLCAVHVFHCRNSHSILLHYELTVTQSIQNIQESTTNYYQGISVPFPAHQPCLREWRWRTTPNLHTETTFNSLYKLEPFEKWGVWHFSEIMFLEKQGLNLFWKSETQKRSFYTHTLVTKVRKGTSWGSKWEGHSSICSLVAIKFKLRIKCHGSIKLREDVTHIMWICYTPYAVSISQTHSLWKIYAVIRKDYKTSDFIQD